ncbi:MAG: hydrogenase iron-sulfur subunit [Armatimonadetes bacterium]|nr:hydrogenase iron-sulfur subunit [Armatimonadota bacterium]
MAQQLTAETATEERAEVAEWRPTLLAYLCNWCSYAGANLAGASRMPYDAAIRVIRVPCSGRVDPLMIYKAFERGVDGVLVGGCHLGDCHYSEGNYACQGRMTLVKALLKAAGIEEGRFRLEWISASEGSIFQAVVNEMAAKLRELGPARMGDG